MKCEAPARFLALQLAVPIVYIAFVVLGFAFATPLGGQPGGWWPTPPELLGVVVASLVGNLGAVAVHELIHGSTASLLGYRVRYGVSWKTGSAYAGIFEQHVSNHHERVITAAPLVLGTSCALLVVFLSDSAVAAAVAVFAGSTNIAISLADVMTLWKSRSRPSEALIYTASLDRQYVLPPQTRR